MRYLLAMIFKSAWSVLGVAFVVLAAPACGGSGDLSSLCSKAQECAEKAGEGFSKTKCENDYKEEAERAETAGCGDEYADYADCVTGIDFQCSDNAGNKIAAECGGKSNSLKKCLD